MCTQLFSGTIYDILVVHIVWVDRPKCARPELYFHRFRSHRKNVEGREFRAIAT